MDFICANCGAIAEDTNDCIIDNGTVLTCNYCKSKTIVSLHTTIEYGKVCEFLKDKARRE